MLTLTIKRASALVAGLDAAPAVARLFSPQGKVAAIRACAGRTPAYAIVPDKGAALAAVSLKAGAA